MVSDKVLLEKAKRVAHHKQTMKGVVVGEVGAALVTPKGNVYVGSSIHANCGVGFCGEHSAVAAMVTAGEYRIKRIVAVDENGDAGPPCGRCRELMYQINPKNLDADVIIGKNRVVKLRDLLPHRWQEE